MNNKTLTVIEFGFHIIWKKLNDDFLLIYVANYYNFGTQMT